VLPLSKTRIWRWNELPISLEEFEKLPKEKPARAKVSTQELLEFLSEQAYSTKEVAAFLNVQTGTAYSRLKRLLQAGKVVEEE